MTERARVSPGVSAGASTGVSPGASPGLSTGVSPGASTGVSTGVSPGLSTGASPGLSTGVSPGVSPGLSTGARTGVSTDLSHGGRWTSLRLAGREWLWRRHDPGRGRVVPGDRFVDAGGLEECVPTVRGEPDHGDAWARAWRNLGDGSAEADCGNFTLRRRITGGGDLVAARYRLTAKPGYRFVRAAHALLDVSARATLFLPGSPEVRLYPEAAALLDRPWPAGAPFVTARWPGPGGPGGTGGPGGPGGLRLDRLGPDDGTAVGAIALGCASATVRDADRRLRLSLHADAGMPTSVALWRNLGGFPYDRPYRSIGVEPMLGSVFNLAEAQQPDDAVTVPRAGWVEWELEIEAAA